MDHSEKLVVYRDKCVPYDKALALSKRVGAPISETIGDGLTLVFDGSGLSLGGFGMRYRGDFGHMLRRVTGGRQHHEMLVRMAKTKSEHPVAVDATAGMGEDSLLLAAAGYEVYMFERDAVIAALLRDAIDRAKRDPLLSELVARMKLIECDSIEMAPRLDIKPELVYLDPMFPARGKSGLVNKKLQLIQKLEQPCTQESELLAAAFDLHPKKIIIKRPLNGAFMADKKPSYSLKGKAIRYDCIVL